MAAIMAQYGLTWEELALAFQQAVKDGLLSYE